MSMPPRAKGACPSGLVLKEACPVRKRPLIPTVTVIGPDLRFSSAGGTVFDRDHLPLAGYRQVDGGTRSARRPGHAEDLRTVHQHSLPLREPHRRDIIYAQPRPSRRTGGKGKPMVDFPRKSTPTQRQRYLAPESALARCGVGVPRSTELTAKRFCPIPATVLGLHDHCRDVSFMAIFAPWDHHAEYARPPTEMAAGTGGPRRSAAGHGGPPALGAPPTRGGRRVLIFTVSSGARAMSLQLSITVGGFNARSWAR